MPLDIAEGNANTTQPAHEEMDHRTKMHIAYTLPSIFLSVVMDPLTGARRAANALTIATVPEHKYRKIRVQYQHLHV